MLLHERHRLSHHQIDKVLGEESGAQDTEEKLAQLDIISGFMGIAKQFNTAGIWFIPLKGPLLSFRIYGDATIRRYKDFDLLVLKEQFIAVLQILAGMGYVPAEYAWPADPYLQNMIFNRLNQYSLNHPGTLTQVEVHWRLSRYPVIRPDYMDELIAENLREIRFAGSSFRQFSPEFELLFLVMHGGIHAWKRLKWLVDIREYLDRVPIRQEKFLTLANQLDAQRMIGLCNALLVRFFPGSSLLPGGAVVPAWFVRFALHRVSDPQAQKEGSFNHSLMATRYRLWSFPGWDYKIARLKGLTGFSTRDLSHEWIPHRHFFFALFRLFRGITQAIRHFINPLKFDKSVNHDIGNEFHT